MVDWQRVRFSGTVVASLLAMVMRPGIVGATEPTTAAQTCRSDLESLPAFLRENDTGAPAHIERLGQAVFDRALDTARAAADAVGSGAECLPVLRTYLRAYRRGHMSIVAIEPPGQTVVSDAKPASQSAASGREAVDPNAPTFRVLSTKTVLITAPSFQDRYGAPMNELIRRHLRRIGATENLIVDVRRNGGGSDSTYSPLMPLLEANPHTQAGAEFLATPVNIEATAAVCGLLAPGSKDCEEFIAPVLKAMRAAKPGTYVLPAGGTRLETSTPNRVATHPRRVAVMIDRKCASSCEEFVLAARQSFKVKLFGRPTFGALDYSNLRPHDLPSGTRRLFYATSRSLRLPAYSVDIDGVGPDHLLPDPVDESAFTAEVDVVRRVMESMHRGAPNAPALSPRR
jgi:hypothetical protein